MAKMITEMAEMETAIKAIILQGDLSFLRLKETVRNSPSPTAQSLMLDGKFLEASNKILEEISGALCPLNQWDRVQNGLKDWLAGNPLERYQSWKLNA